MSSFALRNLVYAQLSFFSFLAVALLLTDEGFTRNHGLSYYGEHVHTIVPYGLGLLCCGAFIWRAAGGVTGPLAPALRVLAVLLFLDLATPDTIDGAFYWAHVAVSAALFVHELAIAVGLVVVVRRGELAALLVAQVAAGLVAMFSQFHVIGYLSVGILIYQLAFGVLLVLAGRDRLVGEEPALTMP